MSDNLIQVSTAEDCPSGTVKNITVNHALRRVRRWLNEHGHNDISLVATRGLRTPADFTKALTLGADCIAISTAAMMSIGFQQYRAYHNNICLVGIARQKSRLRARFDFEITTQRLVNYLEASESELMDFCRMTGHKRVAELSIKDLVTKDMALAQYGGVHHAATYQG